MTHVSLEEKHSSFKAFARLAYMELCKLNRDLLNPFRSVVREIHFKGIGNGAPYGACDGRERNGEHSYQLEFIAMYLNRRWKLGMNDNLLTAYARCHDIVEAIAGDTPAFAPYNEAGCQVPCPTRDDKAERELLALETLEREFGSIVPWLINDIRAYEARGDEESVFIYALDKFISSLNVFQDDGRTNILYRVTYEDQVRVKKPKASKHPVVRMLYELLEEDLRRHPERSWRKPAESAVV